MPEDMPEHFAEDMPEDMPDRVPEDMPGRMPDRMPEDMPDTMPEDMSDRMPEDLPVTKRIDVMVEIARSKVPDVTELTRKTNKFGGPIRTPYNLRSFKCV